MTHRTLTPSLTASAAIAAVLALSSTPALAQDAAPAMDAAPVIDAAPAPAADPVSVTQPATVTAPPPQIVLPPELTTPVTEQVAAPAPVAATPAAASTPRATSATRTNARTAQPEAPARTAETPTASPMAANVASPETLVVPPVAAADARAPAPVAEASEPAQPADGDNTLAIAAILAGLVGIGAAGTLAMRRRYRNSATAYEPAYEPVSARAATPQPVIAPAEAAQVRAYETADATGRGWTVAQDDVALRAPVSRAAPVELADGPVPTGEARQHLLDRMVAATPDAANPFTSNAARRKRARIILAAREHRQRDDATRPFDFRSYRPLNEHEDLPEPALA